MLDFAINAATANIRSSMSSSVSVTSDWASEVNSVCLCIFDAPLNVERVPVHRECDPQRSPPVQKVKTTWHSNGAKTDQTKLAGLDARIACLPTLAGEGSNWRGNVTKARRQNP